MGKPRIRPNYRRRVLRIREYQIWIIVKQQFSTASDRPHHAASTSTPSTNLSPGTVPSLVWPSIGSSWCAIACTSNRGI